jgi:mannose-6-phosphate isomerase-like protein (cupin superfamily)
VKVHSIHDFADWFEVLHTSGRSQVAMMELAPGKATGEDAESHEGSDQVLLLLRGAVKGQMEGDEVTLREGQFVVIPAGKKHRFVNESADAALTFNVYAPPAYPPDAKG